jgi:hypothetical protein
MLGDSHTRVVSPSLSTRIGGAHYYVYLLYMCATRAHLGSHLNNNKKELPIVFVFIPFLGVFVSSRMES